MRISMDETTEEGMYVINMFRSLMRFIKPNILVPSGEQNLPPFVPSDDMPTTWNELLAQIKEMLAKDSDFLAKAGFTIYTDDDQHLEASTEI